MMFKFLEEMKQPNLQ